MPANRGRTTHSQLLSAESFALLVKPWIKAEDLAGPAHLLVSELQAGLARELGGLQGYALSRDRTQLARLRERTFP